jgi:hypothetical protein
MDDKDSRKVGFTLSREARLRLGAACLVHKMSQSEMVEAIIKDSLGAYDIVNDESDHPELLEIPPRPVAVWAGA